jgi:copper chaperone
MQTLDIQIGGMSCQHCVAAVRGALDGLPGVEVEEVRVGSARVRHEPGTTTAEQIRDAIRDEGYQPR